MKKIIFVVAALTLLFALIYSYRIYFGSSKPPDISEEDYLILGDEPPFQMKPLPEDQVEVTVDQETAKQIVDAKAEGFRLELDPKFEVVTSELEPGRIRVYRGNCEIVVVRKDETENMKVNDWYLKNKQELENDIFFDLISSDIEKIEHQTLEAYETSIESEQFGIEKEILIQGTDSIYSISQSNQQGEGCISSKEILDSFRF